MQLMVVLICFALSLTTVNALPWSPRDPMQPALLFQHYKIPKQRNLAKIQLLPRNAISFVGPRQAASAEEDEDDEYYDDDYDGEGENVPVNYAESEEDGYDWR